MPTNQEIIKKADMALSDLAIAGRLSPEQTDQFVRTVMDQPTLIQSCRTVAMNGPEQKINKIGFGSRILRPAVSSTALAATDRVKPDLGQVLITTKEVIAEVHLPYDVIEDNIERGNITAGAEQGAGGIHQTIVDMIGERAALDLEELGIRGDTASADAYLSLADGWLKKASANVVNVGGTFTKEAIKAAVKATPDKYLRNRTSMTHFVSVDNETEMRDQYATRETVMGDANIQGNLPLYVFGSQVKGVPMMPSDSGLFTDPLNLIFAIQRNIQIEYDKDIRSRVFIIVLTARVGFELEEVNALTKYTGITG
jgi:hypothetical protein